MSSTCRNGRRMAHGPAGRGHSSITVDRAGVDWVHFTETSVSFGQEGLIHSVHWG